MQVSDSYDRWMIDGGRVFAAVVMEEEKRRRNLGLEVLKVSKKDEVVSKEEKRLKPGSQKIEE